MNTYQIFLKDSEEIITVEKRKLTIRDSFVTANGAKIGENEQMTLIVPLNSILYITEILIPDVNSSVKNEAENIKQWRFGTEPPKD